MKFFLLIVRNVRRNLTRSIFTSLATMVLVCVVTLVWSILFLLDEITREKSQNLKAIVTERWQVPSHMPFAYAQSLSEGAARQPDDIRPTDSMTWQFFGGTLDPAKRTFENFLFAFAMEPKKLATMMDELEDLTGAQAAELQENIHKLERQRNAMLVGRERLIKINKKIGDTITIYGLNYPDINLEFQIVGTFPPGRYDANTVMNRDYLNDAVDNYARTHNGKAHSMANKSLNIVWLRVSSKSAFSKVAQQVTQSPSFSSPAVKCETLSSGISSFLEAYRDLIWGMRWLLCPAILVTLSLVISNAISISVRERRMEMAVLKVLGFRPSQLLLLVLGEALLIGVFSGMVSAGATWYVVNEMIGGVKFPIGFIPSFFIPVNAIWWGLGIGTFTALAGSIMPAWSARTVKVAEVFSKVA